VLSFTTGSVEASRAIAENAKFFHLMDNSGSVNSSNFLPGNMSHVSVPPEVLAQQPAH
jgi:cystathionine beta-lyase/cystathionine gamma-synthase